MKEKRPETEEEKKLRHEKEAKQLAKWEKEYARPRNKNYLFLILFIICLVQCIDGITTQINTQMQSEITIALFSDRLSIMSIASALAMPMIILTVFYKALADKYGRKPLLVINTLGMAIGLMIVFLAGSVGGLAGCIFYVIAVGVINFFIANDTQVLYIMEIAKPEKRQTTFSIINAIGTLSVIVIPFARKMIMGDDITKWHFVYIIPAIIGVVISFVCLLCARESDVFLENRISYLKKTDEERNEEALEKGKTLEEEKAQGGVLKAFKYAFHHKQLFYIYLVTLIFGLSAFGMQYYEKIADYYFETEAVTSILFFYPIGAAIITFISGFISDHFGRKKVAVAMASLSLIGFGLFFIGCNFLWHPYVVGFMVGIYCGSSWAITDTFTMMTGESSPTNLRASCMSGLSIINLLAKMLAMIVPVVVLLISHDNYSVLGYMCIFGVIPMLALSLVLLIFKVKDTASADLSKE